MRTTDSEGTYCHHPGITRNFPLNDDIDHVGLLGLPCGYNFIIVIQYLQISNQDIESQRGI